MGGVITCFGSIYSLSQDTNDAYSINANGHGVQHAVFVELDVSQTVAVARDVLRGIYKADSPLRALLKALYDEMIWMSENSTEGRNQFPRSARGSRITTSKSRCRDDTWNLVVQDEIVHGLACLALVEDVFLDTACLCR